MSGDHNDHMRMTWVGKAAVGGVLLSVLGGCAEPAGTDTDTAGRTVLLSFIDHIRAGATDDAYGELCSATRDRFAATAFTAFVAQQKKIKGLELASKVNAPDIPVVGPTF